MDETAFVARFAARLPTSAGRPHPGEYPAPALPATWAHFAAVLTAIGGTFAGPVAREQVAAVVGGHLRIHGARRGGGQGGRCVASAAAAPWLKELSGWALSDDGIAHPHGLADVALGILYAEAAVAENAALLFTSRSLPERALGFLAQHLLVLVADGALHPDFVTAQSRLPHPPPHHITWMSGPSKTADIEQTLVIGAHGARTLTVLAITT
ncbi:MAG TPA: LUD domain-containing protein [Polyangia bacterium]